MIRLILIRHAESEMNKLGIRQGSSHDPNLSEGGINQAKRLVERLKEERITKIYSGDKKRVIQTANIVADYFHLNIKSDNRLNEFNMGNFDKTHENGAELFKEYYEKEFNKGLSKYEIRPPNGENYWDLIKRVKSFLKEVLNKEGTILIFSHEGTIEVFLNILDGRDKERDGFRRYHQENTAISEAVFNNRKWKVLKVNDFEHLNLIKPKKHLYKNQEGVYKKIVETIKENIPDFSSEAYLFGSVTKGEFGVYENKFSRHYGSNIDVLVIIKKEDIPLNWRFVKRERFWTIYEGKKIEIKKVKHKIDFYATKKEDREIALNKLKRVGWNLEKIK